MPRGIHLPKKTKLDLFVDAYLDLNPEERLAAVAVLRGIDRAAQKTQPELTVVMRSAVSPELYEDLGKRAAEERK